MSFPIFSVPTWVLVDWDNPLSLPVMGQFDPKVQENKGKPMWETKPGILGAPAWIKYTGEDISSISFEFFAMASNIFDPYPLSAWERINQLKEFDTTLGHPPRVVFNHGLMIAEGYLTDVPEAPMEYWGGENFIRSRVIRQIGPVRITLTRIPKEPGEISLFTNYVPLLDGTEFEEVAKSQYQDARYGQSLGEYNQGTVVGQTLEVPRKSSGVIVKIPSLAPALADDIPGL